MAETAEGAPAGSALGGGPTVDVSEVIDAAPWSAHQKLVLVLATLALVLDGFDTLALGFAAPALLPDLGVTKAALAPVLAVGLIGMTIGAAHLLLAPFPWQLGGGSLRMVLTLPALVYWWWLVFYGLIPGVIYSIRNRLADVRGMLLMLVGFGLLYSLTFGNVGLVFRQRAQLLPWLFILAAVGLEQRALRRLQGLPQIPGQDGAYAVPYGSPAASSPIR